MISTFSVVAQPIATWNWHFGQRAGITFRNGSVETIADGQLNTSEGCASISDPVTGDLLFYTDGVTVWNRIHEIMPNGMGLFGDASTSQSALIVPAPGRPSIYYVFNPAPISSLNVGSRCWCLYYSIVDMRADAGFGDIVKKNELLLNDITEHVTATADCKGDGWWIVVRSRSTRHFYSLHLSRDLLSTVPVASDAGNPAIIVRESGQMHISPDSRQLLITSTAGSSQIYDFDAQTGKVTNGVSLFKNQVFGSHYGAAFSVDSRKVYVAVSNEGATVPTRIYQFSLDNKDADAITSSRYLLGELTGIYTWAPMQIAPDGRIYIGLSGQPWLAMIATPNEDTTLANFLDAAVRLNGVCRFGLPNVIGSMLIEPTLRVTACSLPRALFTDPPAVCAQQCVNFRDISTGIIDMWQWLFQGGSPATSIERNPQQVCYDKPGIYPVRLVVSNAYGTDTAYSNVTVYPTPTLVADSVPEICPGAATRLRASGAVSYLWSPTALVDDPTRPDPLVQPRANTRYTVIGTNTFGCKDTTTVLVSVTDMAASGEVTICTGSSTQLIARGASTYSWFPVSGLTDPRSATPLATPATTTSYVVTMQRGSCIVLDTVTVTVVSAFTTKILGVDRSCVGDTIILTPSAGTVHEWSGAGVIDRFATVCRVVLGTTPAMIRLTSRSGECFSSDSMLLQPLLSTSIDLGADVDVCAGESLILSAATIATNVVWQPTTGLDQATGTSVTCTPGVTTQYIATASDLNGCIRADTIVVVVIQRPLIDAGPAQTICVGGSTQLAATGQADRYVWTPATGLSDSTTLSPIASPLQTTTYVLRALTGSCDGLDSVVVYVSTLDVSITPDTAVCIGEAIRLRASGALRYAWTPRAGLSDTSSAEPLASPRTTTTYNVRCTDQRGCEQVRSVRVVVQDTASIRVIAGSVTARAGARDVGIPIIVEVSASLLPLKITELRATLVNDASVFVPDSTDRGALRTSLRGTDRLSYLLVENVQIISTRQKITEIRGSVLAGRIEVAPLRYEDVSWRGESCPTLTSTNGILYISGCNVAGRTIRTFLSSFIAVGPLPSQDVLSVTLEANQPGSYVLRLLSVDSRVIWSQTVDRSTGNEGSMKIDIDMSSVGSGLYYLAAIMPTSIETIPCVWIR